jgi:hypothetical protein
MSPIEFSTEQLSDLQAFFLKRMNSNYLELLRDYKIQEGSTEDEIVASIEETAKILKELFPLPPKETKTEPKKHKWFFR